MNPIQQTDPLIYDGFAGAFGSFFQAGDPNAHKLTNASEKGVPVLEKTGEEWVIAPDGFATAQVSFLKERCDFWESVGERVPV